MFRKVIVGVSGGVDSAVAAFLLKQKGFDVYGVFLKNWDTIDETGICSAEKDWNDAQFVCDKLKVPVQRVDFVKQYWTDVFENTLKEYQNGETPNPDIYCNKYIKFNAFYRYAKESLSADAIATGHYARTSFGPFLENFCSNQNVKLLQAADKRKDQTFFLSQISQNSLRESMFPLGSMMKPEIKRLAADIGLTRIVKKRESMGICFIGKRKFSDFMSEYVDVKAGEMVDIDSGAVIAHHKGIHHYTIGQGVNVAGMKHKMFAVRKLPDRRTVLVAAGTKHPALQFDLIYTHQPHWIDRSPFDRSNKIVLTVDFRFQHGHKLEICDIVQTQSGLLVKLSKPVRAICAGQFAVFYEGNECLGSAKISATGPSEHILNS